MMDRKMTRREFLRMAGVGVFAVFLLPGLKYLKKLSLFKKSYKEAKYYKKLAG